MIKSVYDLMMSDTKRSTITYPVKKRKKDIKLCNGDGEVLESFEGVYLTHWDTNIHFINKNNDEAELIARPEKRSGIYFYITNFKQAG